LRVELADQVVCGLTHDGAEDPGDVAGNEGNTQLLLLGALRLGLGDHVLVQGLHRVFEACKLHHGVGDLATPEGLDALVEPAFGVFSVFGASENVV
jgi:hypothetical protein